MAEQDRNAKKRGTGGRGKQPLSRHPLFPVTVAIWFGALLGLGSLAIRPTLIESLVVSTGLDLLVPAAAPPLGITARILLALALAGGGGLIGAVIARRIGRPKPEKSERKRGASTILGRQTPAGEPARRRPLTVEAAPRDEFEDFAPLPGGAPQILSIDDYEDSFVNRRTPPAESADETFAEQPAAFTEKPAAREPAPLDVAELDLAAFDADTHESPRFTPFPIDAANAEPVRFRVSAPDNNDAIEAASPVEAELPRIESAPFANGPANPAEAPEPVEMRLTKRLTPARRLFDAPNDGVDSDSPMETLHPALTSEPAEPETSGAETQPETQPEFRAESDNPVKPDVALSDPADAPRAPIAAQTAGNAMAVHEFVRRDSAGADRIISAELGSLSQVELLERLAIAMRARRERTTAPAVIAAPTPIVQAPTNLSATPPPAPFAAPATEPAPTTDDHPSEPPRPAPEAAAAPAPFALPAAFRPIGLDDGNDDFDMPPTFVPARQIFMPQAAPAIDAPAPAPAAFPAPTLAAVAAAAPELACDDEDEASGEDTGVLEEGYSSLLSLSRTPAARTPFVRIEEPESIEPDAIDPVVVFPGHAPAGGQPAASQPFDAPDAPIAPGFASGGDLPASAGRPFDAPSRAAAQGLPVPQAAQNSEETERALRAALASLQRMSGAA